jgi:hydrogenase maturation protein HypF
LLAQSAGGDPALLAACFHASLTAAIVDVAKKVEIESVALTGGCFQNARLVESTEAALHAAGFTVLRHRDLPPNDGGISAGQALGALWGLTEVGGGTEPALNSSLRCGNTPARVS